MINLEPLMRQQSHKVINGENRFFLLFAVATLAVAFAGRAYALDVPSTAYFMFPQYSTCLSFTSTPSFSDINRTGNYWYFDNTAVRVQTHNITVTSFDTSLWINYTTLGAGTEDFRTAAMPTLVLIDGLEAAQGAGWNFVADWVNVTGATTSASIYFVPISGPAVVSVDWYFRSDTDTVNGVTGYVLDTSESDSETTVQETSAGNVTSSWGFRMWLTHRNNSTHELTAGAVAGIVSRNNVSNGYQTSTFTLDKHNMVIGYDALKVILYVRFAAGAWTAKATFTTSTLLYAKLNNGTITFNLFTSRTTSGGNTITQASWGLPVASSGIADMEFTDATDYQVMMFLFVSGDFIQFIMYPFTTHIGNLLSFTPAGTVGYGVILFFFAMTVYLRTKSFAYIMVLFILFGGSGGIITLLIPAAGAGIAWLFMLLGMAGLLYRLTHRDNG